ncbi:MAG TPA: XDD4 family exosortase-dependent surface protein [Verrucomicrobiae bacterium]|nr:XDD4 family exosortase-dependent surface protein [Verrucomicrobiae bacterium]
MRDVRVRRDLSCLLCFWAGLSVAALTSSITPANAAVTYSGSAAGDDPGETNSATATFALSTSGTATDLVVTLTDTAAYKPNDAADILTSVFFTLAGDPTLAKISALLAAGSHAVENGTNLTIAGGVIGGSWAYASGLHGAPFAANEGISATSHFLFGSWNLFPGASLPGDWTSPYGVAGGLTSCVDDGTKYNGSLCGRPFIEDSAVFTLGNVPASFTLSQISNVSFGYGSFPDQVIAAMVPEPSAFALAGAGLLILCLVTRERC